MTCGAWRRGPSRPRCGRPRSRRRPARSACTGCSGCGRARSGWCEASICERGCLVGEAHVVHARPRSPAPAARSGRWPRRPRRRGCARRRAAPRSCGGSCCSRSELGGDDHALLDLRHAGGLAASSSPRSRPGTAGRRRRRRGPSRWQRRGMGTPLLVGRRRGCVWSSPALTSLPFRVKVLTLTACTSARGAAAIVQTPAGQRLSSMCARYSSRK